MFSSEDADRLVGLLDRGKRLAILTGAGISAESGVPTFRGEDGLWKKYQAEDLATPEAFERNPKLVWEWYDWRRSLIAKAQPHAGHKTLALWEKLFPDFVLITQNVDGLHSAAGSHNVLELHGNIWKLRCLREGTVTENRKVPLEDLPPLCPRCGALLRPHVVWFGEPLDSETLQQAIHLTSLCHFLFVIGTSAIVYPSASLPQIAAANGATIVEINPEPTPVSTFAHFSFRGKAGDILPLLQEKIHRKISS